MLTLEALKKEYGAARAEQDFATDDKVKAETAGSIVRLLAAHKALGEVTLGDMRS